MCATRCFPHVVNISVKHGLTALTKVDISSAFSEDSVTSTTTLSDLEGETDPELDQIDSDSAAASNLFLQNDPEYLAALQNDPIKRAQELVNVCRVSGQRREELMEIIKEGNKTGAFPKPVPEVQLLRNVDTRWSSIYLMIDRLLELYPVCYISFCCESANCPCSGHTNIPQPPNQCTHLGVPSHSATASSSR